jgi:hypothetical protein
MHRSLLGLFLLCAVAALAAPAAAGAQTIPDDAAFDQYLEGVPSSRGEENHPAAGEGEPLPPGAEAALGALGPAGERAAALAELTSEKRKRRPDTDEVDGGIGGVIDAVPWGFGLLLLVILAVTAALALALHSARRRAATPEGGAATPEAGA